MKIHDRQGLAILAHIDQPKGAFFEQVRVRDDGKINVPVNCSKLFNEAEYDAVECAGGALPSGFDDAHQLKRIPAFYQASDNPDPEEPTKHSTAGLGALYSWFKLDQIDLEGLRQCFVDPEVRIRLMDESELDSYPKIVGLHIGGTGFLRNQHIDFHDGLNSIIGGKGVGKSLAIEFLRFGLDQPSPDSSLTEDLKGKLEKRLGIDGSVEIVYQLAGGTQYQIKRTYHGWDRGGDRGRPNSLHQCIDLATQAEYEGDVAAIFPILAYSQTEIIKITENKDAQLQLIDRFIDTRQVERDIQEVRERLGANDSKLSKAIQARDLLDDCDREIHTLAERIKTINESLADPLFEAMKQAEAKKQVFETGQSFVQDLTEQVRSWQQEMTALVVEPLPKGFAEDVDLTAHQSKVEEARSRVTQALQTLLADLGGDERATRRALAAWLPDFEKVAAEYDDLLETIGGDRKAKERERRSLEKEKADLERQARTYRALTGDLPDLSKARGDLLDKLQGAHLRFCNIRKAEFDQLTELSDEKLRLSLEHAADRHQYENGLSELLKGGQNVPSVAIRNQIAAAIAPRRLVQLVLDRDAVRLADEAGITELWARRAIEKLWAADDFTEVLALQHDCYPEDVPSIHFRKPGGRYAELSELSVGQKCTALLIIALCDGTMPVVIDQPEDALDIVSVWEDIAKKLRLGKNARQFILTTHNSSVAVSADSDQFIVLRAGANYGKVVAAGAIDRPEVREAVIMHMEGGDEPYGLRSRKYNID